MFRIDLSRRISEFVGVALFALALVWLISLATYSPTDAVWFFNTGGNVPPMNLVGLAGSFLSEASYQVLGLTSYLLPPLLAVVGWYAFWCLPIEAGYTKLIGLVLMVACVSSLLSLTLGTLDVAGKTFLAGGYAGYAIAVSLALQLNRTGAFIIVLTLLALSVILATQFSFSRFFSQIGHQIGRTPAHGRRWWNARRNARQQRHAGNRKAAKAGAAFVSPFIGRLDDAGHDGMELISEIVEIFDNYDFNTEVLVASVRTVNHVKQAAMMGADVCTLPPAVLRQLINHPLTDKGLAAFLADWEKTGQSILAAEAE